VITPAEWLQMQPQKRHPALQAAAIAAGCFSAFQDRFQSRYPSLPEARAANREKHCSAREL
jgi:hypothetical protein